MRNLFRRNRITFLNENWEVIKQGVRVKSIPRADELVYLPEHIKYFRVLNVVYNFDGKQEIFIIIEEH